jgi:hypothetical protein
VLKVSNSYRYIKNIACFLFLIVCNRQFAQTDLLLDAQKLCQEKKYDLALPLIDKVILHPETKNEASAWHIRSYAYLQVYKQTPIFNNARFDLLDTAISAALISMKLDTANEFTANNNSFIKYGAGAYYKASAVFLNDSLNNIKSEKFYNIYKNYTAIVEPTFDFKQKDIEYYKSVGGIFADLYLKNNFNQKYGDISKNALLKVLDLDPKNISANINLGIIYYNQGVTLMQMMDYDVDLAQLDVIAENAKKLFKQSLPFMIKVNELDPKDTKALEGLQGIYSALLDEEKATEFKHKKEALKQ